MAGTSPLNSPGVLICLWPGGSATVSKLAGFLKRPSCWERRIESKWRVLHAAGKCSHCVMWVSAGPGPAGLTLFFQSRSEREAASVSGPVNTSVLWHGVLVWLRCLPLHLQPEAGSRYTLKALISSRFQGSLALIEAFHCQHFLVGK